MRGGRRLGGLSQDPRNANRGTDRGRAMIEKSIEEAGFGRPILADRKRRIIAGNQTYTAAQATLKKVRFVETSGDEVVVHVRKDLDLDDPRARKLAVVDNQASLVGLDFDPARLAEVEKMGGQLLASGVFTSAEWKKAMAGLEAAAPEGADTPPTPIDYDGPAADECLKRWPVQFGELWKAGEHRILCADFFEIPNRARLLGKAQPAAIVTDPPYAIYGSATGIASDIADDKMVRPFFEAVFRAAFELLPWFAHVYMCCDWRSWAAVWESAKRSSISAKNLLVWDKGGQGLGSNYAMTYELCGFFAKLPPKKAVGNHPAGQRVVMGRPNLLRYPRPVGEERLHNAAKPVEWMEEMINNSTDKDDLVLDPFAGSGTTLVAAQRLGRRGAAMDLEPKCVASTLERLARLGLKPKRVEG